jgi:hypothetical protein
MNELIVCSHVRLGPFDSLRRDVSREGGTVYFRSALFALLAPAFSAVAQNTAIIQGTILDASTGKPVSGAVVMASKTTPPVVRPAATSSYDGTFQLPALAAGAYDVCVQMPRMIDGYLNTCQWGGAPTTITVAAGQKLTGNTLKIKPGSVLKIHMDDAGKLLNQKNRDGNYPDLVMGVWNAGMFYPAHISNLSTKGAPALDYQVTVPVDTNLNFSIQSRRLALGDSNKKPLPINADHQAFQHPSNSNADKRQSFSYSILSVNP